MKHLVYVLINNLNEVKVYKNKTSCLPSSVYFGTSCCTMNFPIGCPNTWACVVSVYRFDKQMYNLICTRGGILRSIGLEIIHGHSKNTIGYSYFCLWKCICASLCVYWSLSIKSCIEEDIMSGWFIEGTIYFHRLKISDFYFDFYVIGANETSFVH